MQRRQSPLLAVALAAALAACSSPTPAPTPTTDRAASPTATGSPTSEPSPGETATVEIGVGSDRRLTMPTNLEAGAYVFEVSASMPTEVTVLEPLEGYTKEQLAVDFGPHDTQEASMAAWGRFDAHTRSLAGTWWAPDREHGFARILEPGTYWFVDLYRESGDAGDDDVLDVANILTVEVTGSPGATALPEPDAEAEAREDRSWQLPASIPAGGTLLLRNPTEASHRLLLEPVPDDSSPEEWLRLSRLGRGIECLCNSPARIGPGEEFLWLQELQPGHYVVTDYSLDETGALNGNGQAATLVEVLAD